MNAIVFYPAEKLSEASLNVLSMTGREANICAETPEECVDASETIPTNSR